MESSTDKDKPSCYETAPESPSYRDDKDDDDLPPCAGACTVTVGHSGNDGDLSNSEGSRATIMDLRNGPHLDCCISHPGELGNPLGDCVQKICQVWCTQVKTLTHQVCPTVINSTYIACRMINMSSLTLLDPSMKVY